MHLQDGATDFGNVTYTLPLGTMQTTNTTFTNAAPMTIPATGTGATTGAPASLYPSPITVAGLPPVFTGNITVTLTGLTHTFPDDIDMLLVSPTGTKFIVMSDAGGGAPGLTAVNLALSDTAASVLTDGLGIAAGGPFRPADYTTPDAFPAPAPAAPYLSPVTVGAETLGSAFTGVPGGNPNGVWNLYVVDDANLDAGTMSGWSLTFGVTSPVCATTLSSGVDVSGTVRNAEDRGVTNTVVTLTDNTGMVRRVVTGRNGSFTFTDVEAGQTYVVGVMSKRYYFAPQIIQVTDSITGLVFTAGQ